MALRERLRCPTCGSLREEEAFNPFGSYELALAKQEIGGRGKCSWEFVPLPMPLAIQIRDRLREALEQVEAEIADAEERSS